MLTVMIILAVSALITVIVAIMGKCPLWVSSFLMAVWICLRSIPLG